MINKNTFFDELAKIGAISDEQARASLDRLDTLERNKPTVQQVGRYAGLGAVAGPVIGAVGNAMRGGRQAGTSLIGHLAGAARPGVGGIARAMAGSAATGAVGSGMLPLVRNQLDRRAEIGTLKTFMQQHELPPASPGPAGTEVSGKIAAAKSQSAQEAQEDGHLRRAGLGLAGGLAGGVGNMALGAYVHHQATAERPDDVATMGKIRQNASVPVHDAPHGVNAFIAPTKVMGKDLSGQMLDSVGMKDVKLGPEGAVLLGQDTRSPGVLAHELGHADIHASRAGRVIQNVGTRTMGAGAGGIGMLSGAVSGMSDDPNMHALGLAAPALAAAPMLAHEGLASIKAIKHLRNAGATAPQMWRAAKTLVPAWGTYATHAGMGVANAAVSQGLTGAARGALSTPEQ